MLLPLPALQAATVTPLTVTGWNEDIVINGQDHYDTSITATVEQGTGSVQGWTLVDTDFHDNGGIPIFTNGVSRLYSGIGGGEFLLEPHDQLNALLLTSVEPSGTLHLTTGASFSTISLAGFTGNGDSTATITLSFTDLTTTTYTLNGTGITRNWTSGGEIDSIGYLYGTAAAVAPDYSTILYQHDSELRMYASDLTLSLEDQYKVLGSITITNTSTSPDRNLAIMGVSGEVVPEASVAALTALCGLVGMARRRR